MIVLGWMRNVSVLISCAVITSIMSAFWLKDTMWTMDTRTLWYGYIFLLFQGMNLLPTILWLLFLPLLFLPELPLLLSICSFTHLGWGHTCPLKRYSQPLDMHFGKGDFQISWLCTFWFSVTDFWTPASVYEIPNPPPSEVWVLQWLQLSSSSSFSQFF